MADRTVPATSAAVICGFAGALGIPYDEVLRHARVDPSCFGDPDARVSVETFYRVWALLLSRFPGQPLGRQLGGMYSTAHLGTPGMLIRHSPTIWAASAVSIRYQHFIDPSTMFARRIDDDVAIMSFEMEARARELVQPVEAVAALTVAMFRELQPDVKPLFVRMPHTAVVDGDFLGVPVEYSAPEAAVGLRLADAMRPVPGADPNVLRYLHHHLEAVMEATSPQRVLEDRLIEAITRSLEDDGDVGQTRIARQLALSVRTLQRRLAEEGLRYRALVDEVRSTHAYGLLRRPDLSVTEIAFLLGFEEPASFSRAFRRWTGVSPVQYRARAMNGGK